MKMGLLFVVLFGLVIYAPAQVTIQVNPQYVIKGIVTGKKGNKPLVNAPITVYAYDRSWVITTGKKGEYYLDLGHNGTGSPSPIEMDGNNNILFYYSDKRYCLVPTKAIQMEKGDVDGLPVARCDVRL